MNTRTPILLALAALCAPSCGPAQEAAAVPGPVTAEARPGFVGSELQLGAAEQASLGLEFAVPAALEHTPETRAYGRVLADPAAGAELRAPLAGKLLAGDVTPALGLPLAAGSVGFRLLPRWSPTDLADLEARLAGARGERAALAEELPALEAEAERARSLNDADKNVSDRERLEAETRLRTGQARLSAARELERALEAARAGSTGTAVALLVPAEGEVVELLARAGEEVESGAPLLRLVDFRTLLVALDLPPGTDAVHVRAARIERGDAAGEFLPAERIGVAPTAGPAGLAPALLFRIRPGAEAAHALRPGLRISAWLDLGQPAQAGVLVPAAAVVRLAGQGFVYARRGADVLERLPVELDVPIAGGWFSRADWTRAAPELVVRGAGSVLSCELLGRQSAEEDE